MAVKYIDDNNPDGAVYGQTAASKVAFWGKDPIVQPSGAAQAAAGTTAATTTNAWGCATSTQADALIVLVDAMRTALVNAGIMKGAA